MDYIDIDETWTSKFRDFEKDYEDFYKGQLESIKLFFLYVNKSDELVSVQSERIMMDSVNTLTKETLCGLIKLKEMCKYKLDSLLRFNINIDPQDVINDMIESKSYLYEENYLNDICFQETIYMFHDLNSLFFIFKEISNTNTNRPLTRKRLKTLIRKTRNKRA